jgi:polar amino acid transport system permease protein
VTDPSDAALPPRPDLFYTRRLALTGRRGLWASVASCAVVVGGLLAVAFLAPGSSQVRHFFFNGHYGWQAFVGDPSQGIDSVGRGLVTNIWMFLAAEVLILIFGLVIAATRISRSPVLLPFRVLATVYTDVFRGVPVLLVVLMVGFGVPGLYIHVISYQSPAVYGVAALTLTYSAYVAEVFRAGIFSVPHGQLLAARSLGLTYPTTMRRVILPQAVRTVVPPLLNDFISLQKDTALVGLLGAVEATRAAQIAGSTVFNYTGYVVAAALFLVMTIPMTRYTDHLIARDRARRLAGAT